MSTRRVARVSLRRARTAPRPQGIRRSPAETSTTSTPRYGACCSCLLSEFGAPKRLGYVLLVPTLRIEEIRSLQEYTELIAGLMAGDTQLWYRGVGKVSHDLTPSLYRHPSITDIGQLLALEQKLLQRFRERSIPYEERPFVRDDVWEYLFLMQHYGVPTRLLDWTENPYIGLYFAVTSARVDPHTRNATEDACVWVLNPGPWNATALADISFPSEVLSVPDQPLEAFQPKSGVAYMRNTPVALYGLHNSARIVAQRGVFTIFGQSTATFDETYTSGTYSADTLVKAVIPSDAVDPLMRSLFAIGITDSVVYPDLAGLALDVKRHFGFPV